MIRSTDKQVVDDFNAVIADTEQLLKSVGSAGNEHCLLGDFRFSDTAGFILTAVVVLWQWRQRLRIAAVAA